MAAFYCIGDEDAVLGFRYAGVPGEVAAGVDEALEAFTAATKAEGLEILIITDPIADAIRRTVDEWRAGGKRPLVVEIPSAEGPPSSRRDLMDLIREAVGMRL